MVNDRLTNYVMVAFFTLKMNSGESNSLFYYNASYIITTKRCVPLPKCQQMVSVLLAFH